MSSLSKSIIRTAAASLGLILLVATPAQAGPNATHEVVEVRSSTPENYRYPGIDDGRVKSVVPGSTALVSGKVRIWRGMASPEQHVEARQRVTYYAMPTQGLESSMKRLMTALPEGYSVTRKGQEVPLSATLRFRNTKDQVGKVSIPLALFQLGADYSLIGSKNGTDLAKRFGDRATRLEAHKMGFKKATLYVTGNDMMSKPRARLQPTLISRAKALVQRALRRGR